MPTNVLVIVPGKNCAGTLAHCLNSLSSIRYPNLTVIYVDNGSTDQSVSIARRFADTDARFSIQIAINSGVSVARNVGLSMIKSEQYVAFVDSDDEVTSNFLSDDVLKAMHSHKDFIFCDWVEARPNSDDKRGEIGGLESFTQSGLKKHFLRHRSGGAPWAKYYRSDILKKNKIRFNEDLSYGEDYIFNFEFITHSNTIEYIRQVVYRYTVGQDNNKYSSQYINNFLNIDDELLRILPNRSSEEKLLINENRMEQIITPFAQDLAAKEFKLMFFDLRSAKMLIKKFKIQRTDVFSSDLALKFKLVLLIASL